ncbi:MAG: hypothetical protein U9Q82_10825 [Chloroflexota bacterium]|nr:hypothetical protein [Chloroflexota bacterium]
MMKLNRVKQIQQQARDLERRLMSSDVEAVKAAFEEYRQLVGLFYQENEGILSPHQYSAAKKDFGYFAALVELALNYYKQESYGDGS